MSWVELALRILLAGVLAAAAVGKLARPRASTEAMATFGFSTPAARRAAWGFAVLAEAGLAVGIALGSDRAAYLAAALMAMFALTLGSALLQGRAGAPCACFGGGSTVGWPAIARNLLLAAGFAVLPSVPSTLSTDEWLGVGLAIALLAVVVLGVVVFALAREIGMLRLRLGPAAALEIAHEGPEVGGRSNLVDRIEMSDRDEIALAVFTSEGCRVCHALVPAVESLRNEPGLAVRTFEEGRDRRIWEAAGVPGAPYAVAMDRDGVVGAKGTFNNLAQLESILATAERRREPGMAIPWVSDV